MGCSLILMSCLLRPDQYSATVVIKKHTCAPMLKFATWQLFALAGALREREFDLTGAIRAPHRDRPFIQGLTAKITCDHFPQKLEDCSAFVSRQTRLNCIANSTNECLTVYESSGLYGKSFVQKINDFRSGTPIWRQPISAGFFAEGLTMIDDGSFVLGTWREERLLQFTENTEGLALLREIEVRDPSQIWGLAADRDWLYMTSGDGYLYKFKLPLRFESPKSRQILPNCDFRALRPDAKVSISHAGRRVRMVNELEVDRDTGLIWANIWMKDQLISFDPVTGVIKDRLSLSDHFPQIRTDNDKVWNGLASLGGGWWLFTGKLFDDFYLAKLKD